MIKDLPDIQYLVQQLAERLGCAWAQQSDYYRLEFADGLTLSASKRGHKEKLRISVMLGNLYRFLGYQEHAAAAEFNTDKVSYIASYIERSILPLAKEQWERVCRTHQKFEADEQRRRDIALAIAAQCGGTIRNVRGYDFYRDCAVHQYADKRSDSIGGMDWTPTASYQINLHSVDIKASVPADMAVWFAYLLQHPEALQQLPALLKNELPI